REALRLAIDAAFKGGGAFEREYRTRYGDGKYHWVSSRGRVEVEAGQALRMRGVSIDITRRKEAELELARHRGELAHLSRVATLGDLPAPPPHELTQPLTAILSNAQAARRFLAQDGGNIEEVREILEDIAAADRRAGEVIHRIRLLLRKGIVE